MFLEKFPYRVKFYTKEGEREDRPVYCFPGVIGGRAARCLGQRKPYNRPGALWGLRVLKFDGAIAPRVLKFDSGFAAEGCGGRL